MVYLGHDSAQLSMLRLVMEMQINATWFGVAKSANGKTLLILQRLQMPWLGWLWLFTDILRPFKDLERLATLACSMTEVELNPDNYYRGDLVFSTQA